MQTIQILTKIAPLLLLTLSSLRGADQKAPLKLLLLEDQMHRTSDTPIAGHLAGHARPTYTDVDRKAHARARLIQRRHEMRREVTVDERHRYLKGLEELTLAIDNCHLED